MSDITFETFAGINEGAADGGLSLKICLTPGSSCGPNPDYRPGVGMSIQSNFIIDVSRPLGDRMLKGEFWTGGFVMSRTDATKLRDELEIFLKQTARDR